jgi:predicted  nucleic acid-binding Zn-ribbon protein
MDNFRLKENHKEVMKAQQERIEALNDEIVNLDNRKQELASNFEAEKEDLEKLLQSKYERRDELNQ